MSPMQQDAEPQRLRTRKRDDDHGDVWWECGVVGCPSFFVTPAQRDEHEKTCEPEVEPWD